MSEKDPTADYRKYPKGPNFLLIVILSAVAILVVLAIGVFVVGDKGKKLVPHGPNPTPNSSVLPGSLVPGPNRDGASLPA